MRYKSFHSFVDKKQRDDLRHLKLIEQLLVAQGFRVDDFISEGHEDDPYIFVHNNSKNTSFDGVRIYKIGSDFAFKIQKESETHPYGNNYPLKIEEMFEDLMTEEDMDELRAGKLVMQAVAKELQNFFRKSEEAESDNRAGEIMSDDNLIGVKSTGTDYSSKIYSSS